MKKYNSIASIFSSAELYNYQKIIIDEANAIGTARRGVVKFLVDEVHPLIISACKSLNIQTPEACSPAFELMERMEIIFRLQNKLNDDRLNLNKAGDVYNIEDYFENLSVVIKEIKRSAPIMIVLWHGKHGKRLRINFG